MAAAVSALCALWATCTQEPHGCIILMLPHSYYTLFLSRALLLQVEHPVNAAAQLPALSPVGREQGQSRLNLQEWVDVAQRGCRGVPTAEPKTEGST